MASYDNNRIEQDPLVPLDRFGMPTLGVISNSTGSFVSTDSSISAGAANPNTTNANYNKFKSQVEKTIMTSRNPIRVYETAKTTANGYTGLWLNKSENMNWKGAKNIEEYPIFNDPNPELIQKKPEDCIATSQKITYKFLKPPPIVEDIIIKKEADRRMPELPPLVIRIKQPAKKRLIYEIDVEKYKIKEHHHHHHKHVVEYDQYETNLSACYQPTQNQYGLQMPAVSYQDVDTNLSADFGKQMYITQEPIVGAHYDEYAVDSGLMQHGNDFSTSSTSSLELRTKTYNAFNKKVQSRHRNNERVLKKNTKTESKSKRHHSVHVSHDLKHKQHHHHHNHGKSTKNHRY